MDFQTMNQHVREMQRREAALREEFCARCGVTTENAHEFTEIVRPGQQPLVLDGRMEIHHDP